MPSENAKSVAREVIDRVRKGKKVVLGEIIRKQGYSKAVSVCPTKVTKTESYQEEIKPVVQRMKELRDRTIKAISGKELDDERLVDLNNLMKNLNHDIQLLSGEDTEKNNITISWE